MNLRIKCPVPVSEHPVPAIVAEECISGTYQVKVGELQVRINPETRIKEYRIVWTGGRIEPTTPEEWLKRTQGHEFSENHG